LHNLVSECGVLGEVQAQALVLAVARISDSLEADFLNLGEWARARAVLFVAAKRFCGTQQLQEVLSRAIREATSDAFAADILRFSTRMRDQNKIITDWRNVDEAQIRAAFAERMRAEYPVGSSEEGPYDRKGDLSPFLIWAAASPEDQKREAEFFRDRFRRYPADVGRFLGWALPRHAMYQEDPLLIIDKLFGTDELFEFVRQLDQKTLNVTDQDSVQWFLELVGKRRGGHADDGVPPV